MKMYCALKGKETFFDAMKEGITENMDSSIILHENSKDSLGMIYQTGFRGYVVCALVDVDEADIVKLESTGNCWKDEGYKFLKDRINPENIIKDLDQTPLHLIP